MDPHLREEIKSLLDDLWSGTDLELALAKGNLYIARRDVEPITDRGILEQYAEAVRDELRQDGHCVTVRESWDGEPFDAVSMEALDGVLDGQIESLFEE